MDEDGEFIDLNDIEETYKSLGHEYGEQFNCQFCGLSLTGFCILFSINKDQPNCESTDNT